MNKIRFLRIREGMTDSLSQALRPEPITAFVGGGGKTSTMLTLAWELAEQGKRVIVTTTTHILPVNEPLPANLKIVGMPAAHGKLGPVSDPDGLKQNCDYLLIEADGSRGLPAKAPADHEPVLTPATGLVVAVQGMTAIGGEIQTVCHRPERVCCLLKKQMTDRLSTADAAKLLLSEQGQRKNAGGRRYAVVLNQADDIEKQRYAEEIAGYLPKTLPCVITSYRE